MTYLKVDLPRTFRGPIASAELPRVSAHTVPGKFLRLKRFIFPGLLIMKEVRKKPRISTSQAKKCKRSGRFGKPPEIAGIARPETQK